MSDPIPKFSIKNPFLLKLWLALTVLTSLAFYAQWQNSEARCGGQIRIERTSPDPARKEGGAKPDLRPLRRVPGDPQPQPALAAPRPKRRGCAETWAAPPFIRLPDRSGTPERSDHLPPKLPLP